MLGKQVEGYSITKLVGKGGMGVVYQAVHDTIGQRAAVKVLFPEFSTDVDAVSRFVAEARAASKVRHSGLVKIFYSGRLEDGTAYIMMEFLDGESIEERLRRLAKEARRLDLAQVIRLGQQVASALSAVHREGIIHRDLKPANLILVADSEIDGGERIKLVDFGIAKFDASSTEVSKTTVGRFLGTALYASPEQCQMSGEVGRKSDVYSLGVMLYEMLAGSPPFVADQPGVVIGLHLFREPSPLWEAAPDVPESLHQLIHQMLAKDAAQRPSMDEVSARLGVMKTERPRLLWRLRRDRRALTAAAAAGVVVLAGAGTLWQLGHRRLVAHRFPATAATQPLVPSVIRADLAVAPPPHRGESVDLGAAADLLAPWVPVAPDSPLVADVIRPLKGKAGHRGAGRRSRPGEPAGPVAAEAPHDRAPALVGAAPLTPAGEPAAPAPTLLPLRTPTPPSPPVIKPTESGENKHAKPTADEDGILR